MGVEAEYMQGGLRYRWKLDGSEGIAGLGVALAWWTKCKRSGTHPLCPPPNAALEGVGWLAQAFADLRAVMGVEAEYARGGL